MLKPISARAPRRTPEGRAVPGRAREVRAAAARRGPSGAGRHRAATRSTRVTFVLVRAGSRARRPLLTDRPIVSEFPTTDQTIPPHMAALALEPRGLSRMTMCPAACGGMFETTFWPSGRQRGNDHVRRGDRGTGGDVP